MNRKLLLSLGTIGISAASVASVVSCGNNKTKDHDSVFKYEQSGSQFEVIENVNNYNLETFTPYSNTEKSIKLSDEDFKVIKTSNSTLGKYVGILVWKTENLVWSFSASTTSLEYIKLKLDNLILDIKMNKPSAWRDISKYSNNSTKTYMGYIYKKYFDSIWSNKYSDFSTLKERFPFMEIEENDYQPGEWNIKMLHNDTIMWNGLATDNEVAAGLTDEVKRNIHATTPIGVYTVKVDDAKFDIIFDHTNPMPKILERKIISDLLINKHWSDNLLVQKGIVISSQKSGRRGAVDSTARVGGYVLTPNSYIQNPSDYEQYYNNYSYLRDTEEILHHEFGHLTTTWWNDVEKDYFQNSRGNYLTDSFFDRQHKKTSGDPNAFKDVEDYFRMNYDKVKVNLKDVFNLVNTKMSWEDFTTLTSNGTLFNYQWSNEAEFFTEFLKQFEEAPLLEKSPYIDPIETIWDRTPVRNATYLTAMGHPLWNADMSITDFGKDLRKHFMKTLFRNTDTTTAQIRWALDENDSYIQTIIGMAKNNFDFITATNERGETITVSSIKKIKADHTNRFTKDKLMSSKQTIIHDQRIGFSAEFNDRHFIHKNNNYTLKMYQDTNGDGNLDLGDTLVESKDITINRLH